MALKAGIFAFAVIFPPYCIKDAAAVARRMISLPETSRRIADAGPKKQGKTGCGIWFGMNTC
jgi:hypothetical protein